MIFTKSIFFCHFSGKSVLDHLRQKLLQSRVFRMIEKFFRRVFLFDPAFIHKQHSRTDFPGKAHLVGNDHHCHTLVGHPCILTNTGRNVTDLLLLQDIIFFILFKHFFNHFFVPNACCCTDILNRNSRCAVSIDTAVTDILALKKCRNKA